jgi:hypothetical protein
MNRKLAIIVAAAALLSGCATNYTLMGQRYTSAEEFQKATDGLVETALGSVTPLSAPLTKKKLIFAFPAQDAIYQENIRRATLINGRAPMGPALEIASNLSRTNFKLSKVFYDAVQKKGIYPSAQFKDMPSMTVSIEPSTDTDVLYFTEPSQGAGQWFYSSAKHGRQVFAFDRSGEGAIAKTQAFIDAVQAQAIRE